MKIFLTGGNGMVGKNILHFSKANKYDFLHPSSKELDLKNYSAVNDYIKLHKPDFIIHAAGFVGGIQANIANPVKFLTENLEIGKNIMVLKAISLMKCHSKMQIVLFSR